MCSRSSISVGETAQSLEHLDEKNDHDEVLGSRLELELNRSIEKMREEEVASPISYHIGPEDSIESNSKGSTTDSPQPQDESPTAPINYTVELLEDIEMPNLSISQCESADLISVSSASPNSPVKLPDRFKVEFSSGPSFSAADTSQIAQLKAAPSLQFTGEPDTNEMDVYEKVAFLSAPLTSCVKTLVSVDEIDTASDKEVDRESHAIDVLATDTQGVESEMVDITTNVTSSPVTSLDLHLTLGTGFELLDLDNVNDSLLTTSVMANFLVKEKNNGMYDVSLPPTIYKKSDPVEEKKELSESETSYSSGFLTEACGIVAELEDMASSMMSSSLTSPDHQMTIHPLDMDAMNDSLLNSVSLRNSPDKETHLQDAFVSPPTPLVSEKKFLENKYEVTTSNGNVRMNYTFDGSAKLLNEAVDDTDVEKMIKLQEDKKNFEGTVTNTNYEKPKQCLNSTFDHQKTRQCMNTTYDQKGIHPALNSTFDKHLENTAPIPHDGNIANTTFIQKGQCVNRISDGKNTETENPSTQFMNTTFEKEHQTANDTFVSKPLTSEVKENDKLNVTFERGEYKIPSLNESVNLMDAEGEVLQLILDSTPQKASKRCPEAVSTPKCGDKPPQLASKRTLTKDTAQSFLHRISLGVRRDSQSQAHQENKSSSSQDANTRPVIPGLRLGCVDHQAVASQLRRLHNGASSVRSGPMRALPLQSVSGTHSHEKPHDSVGTPDSLEGMKGLPHSNCNSNTGSCIHPGERNAAPSFGSVSSNENERPGTPDIGIITGIGLSTPDVFRSEDPIAGPRITSTPAMRGGVFSCVVGIEGQAPTPITAPPSRSRVVSISSTASLPEARCNDSLEWQGFSQESVKDSRRTASIPDSSSSGISKEIFPISKLTPDNLDCGISVGTGEMPKVRQIVGTGGLCAESVNVQRNYEKICNQGSVTVEPEKSAKDILNQETEEVGSGITHEIEIMQGVYSDVDSCPKSSIISEGKQNVVATIKGEHHSKSDVNINTHNSGIQMSYSEFIASDNQEASVCDVGHCHLSGAITEVKEQFITYSESRIDARKDLTTKGKATNSVEIPHISDMDDEYQTKAVVLEGQQSNSTVAVEQKLELTGDEKKQIQTSSDKKQQGQSGVENQLAENSSFEKEHVNTSNDKVHQMETTVGESQQVKTTVGEEVNTSTAENQQLGAVVNENELVVTAVGEKQQIDGKRKESSVSDKLQVKTNAICSQTLQDYNDISRQSKELKKSHSMADVETNQTGGNKKTKNNLKICKEVSKEINLINRQHSKASGSTKSSLVLKVSTVSASLVKDKPGDQSSKTRSHSHTDIKHIQSTCGAQSDPDKNIADSSVAVKMNLGKDVPRKKTNTMLRKSISNDGRPLQSSVRSFDKDDKENKKKSTTISSRQITSQSKSGVSVVHGKKTPFTRPVLGSSNYGARRSLVNQPVALSNEFSAGKVPIKTSTNLRHSKANSVDLKITNELKKAKDFTPEPQSASPKFPSAVKQHTDPSLLKGHLSSSGVSGKTMLKVKNTPVAVHHRPKHTHEQQKADSNLQGNPTAECDVKTKLSRRSAGIAPVVSRKPSLLRVPKPLVR